MESITWKIGGEAGFGIFSAGTMLARAFSRAGYFVFATNEYPSLIRGGHNLVTVRISSKKFESMNRDLHLLVALNKETVDLHKQELSSNAFVLFDPKDYAWKSLEFNGSVQLVPVPLTELVRQTGGENVMRNTVALGATMALLGVDFSLLQVVIADQFKRKGADVVMNNTNFAKVGYEYIKKEFASLSPLVLTPPFEHQEYLICNASEVVGIGAVRAGMKFAAIYPMTPINALITFLADHAKSLGVVYKQPEDEIAGINMAIGASVAGVRSMVATSGGGFALMVEGVSLAGMIEVPLVIDMGMRVGPATGMPTWTEQGELQFVIHAGHGEFPRIVLAPGDAHQAYTMTIEAFDLADRYQIPVFVLTDKYLNESQWCVPRSYFQADVNINRGLVASAFPLAQNGSFKRYVSDTPDGVSPRSFPGMKQGQYIANSYEHDEAGYVMEQARERKAMVEKRMRKLAAISLAAQPPIVYGNSHADITFVTWGSSKGPILELLESHNFTLDNHSANLVQFGWLYPFPTVAAEKLLQDAKRIIDLEQNATGQLASLIREHTGIAVSEKILKYDGRPFYPEEIVERVA